MIGNRTHRIYRLQSRRRGGEKENLRARLIRRSDRALFGAHHDREAIVLGHGFLLFIIRFESGFFEEGFEEKRKKERKERED